MKYGLYMESVDNAKSGGETILSLSEEPSYCLPGGNISEHNTVVAVSCNCYSMRGSEGSLKATQYQFPFLVFMGIFTNCIRMQFKISGFKS